MKNWLENIEINIFKKVRNFIKSKKIEKLIYDEIKLNVRVLNVLGGLKTLRYFLKIGT
jgi:hypothetical protein|tara:strand:+ start:534 stop:707 length:174 start_codon:yes stop_codon:yes gene_type:complete